MTDKPQIPLQPAIARKIVIDLFNEKSQWLRSDLVRVLVERHKQSGGVLGQQDPVSVTKKVLGYLQEEGRVIKTGAKGLWAKGNPSNTLEQEQTSIETSELVSTNKVEEELDDIVEDSEKKIIQLGSGSEAVYLYYSPSDKELADIKGLNVWECKIGMTTVFPVESRIFSQGVKTAFSRMPVVALIIKTDNAVCLERAIHSALRLAQADAPDSPATEWFITNPQRVIDWYNSFIDATNKLKI